MSDLIERFNSWIQSDAYDLPMELKEDLLEGAERIAELEADAADSLINWENEQDDLKCEIKQLESDLAGCIKLIAKYESERDD